VLKSQKVKGVNTIVCRVARSQSYDHELQRRRCKCLQRN
jgi:hypothetical protein